MFYKLSPLNCNRHFWRPKCLNGSILGSFCNLQENQKWFLNDRKLEIGTTVNVFFFREELIFAIFRQSRKFKSSKDIIGKIRKSQK